MAKIGANQQQSLPQAAQVGGSSAQTLQQTPSEVPLNAQSDVQQSAALQQVQQVSQFESAQSSAGRTLATPPMQHPQTSGGAPASRGQSVLSMALSGLDGLSRQDEPLFALENGQMYGAVGLNDVLGQVPKSAEGKAMVEGLLQQIEASTGVEIPPGMVDAVLANPARLSNVLQLSPAEMKRGVQALNARHAAQGPDANANAFGAPTLQLPPALDMAQLADLDITVPEPEMTEVGPGLWRGSRRSDLGEAQAKTNIAMANVFDRLAANGQDGEPFEVTYQGQSFDRLDTFLEALQADGHTVEVKVNQRVANFAGLMTQGPDGQMVDVPAPLFVRTGVVDAEGNEAAIPSVHSELTITIRKGDDTEGPGFDADLKWYQGISGTGFFPDKIMDAPAWAGSQNRDIGTGQDAIEAIKLAGMFSDSVNETAAEQDLWLGGYGTTGVCNDSVAVIEHAMTGRNLTYPLLMTDESILPELAERLAANPEDSEAYQRLMDSVEALPSDAVSNETSHIRAANTIPWEAGTEPFASTAAARQILSQQ